VELPIQKGAGMTREEAKEIFLNRGFVNGLFDGDKWRESVVVISKWLEQEPCDDCISREAVIEHYNSGEILQCNHVSRNNLLNYIEALPPVTPKPRTGHWIPVSERLPKPFRYVNCTCHSLIDDREDWVVETFYLPQPPNSPYSDWGNIPMLNHCECEVIAWMYRDIPEPYVPDTNIGKMSEIPTDSEKE
jgi:hypothetical protein